MMMMMMMKKVDDVLFSFGAVFQNRKKVKKWIDCSAQSLVLTPCFMKQAETWRERYAPAPKIKDGRV